MSLHQKIEQIFQEVPKRRLPLGKNAWLQEWNDAENHVLALVDGYKCPKCKEYAKLVARQTEEYAEKWAEYEKKLQKLLDEKPEFGIIQCDYPSEAWNEHMNIYHRQTVAYFKKLEKELLKQ